MLRAVTCGCATHSASTLPDTVRPQMETVLATSQALLAAARGIRDAFLLLGQRAAEGAELMSY